MMLEVDVDEKSPAESSAALDVVTLFNLNSSNRQRRSYGSANGDALCCTCQQGPPGYDGPRKCEAAADRLQAALVLQPVTLVETVKTAMVQA